MNTLLQPTTLLLPLAAGLAAFALLMLIYWLLRRTAALRALALPFCNGGVWSKTSR